MPQPHYDLLVKLLLIGDSGTFIYMADGRCGQVVPAPAFL